MKPIIIPEHALINKTRFEDWYLSIANQLFPSTRYDMIRLEIKGDDSKIVTLFEDILFSVNLIYNGNPRLIDYRNKNKKLNKYKSDMMSVAFYVIRSYYKIGTTKLGKLLNMNHATILHHCKKQAGFNESDKENRIKYLRLIKHLQDEKIIPIATESKSNTKRVLPNVLSGQK